jgi:hypothetical protein
MSPERSKLFKSELLQTIVQMTAKSSVLQMLHVNTEQFVCELLNILLFANAVGVFVAEMVREKKSVEGVPVYCDKELVSVILAAYVQNLANIISKTAVVVTHNTTNHDQKFHVT